MTPSIAPRHLSLQPSLAETGPTIPGAHRRGPRRGWLFPLAGAGVLVSVAVSAFVLGLDWHVTDREALVSRMVTACHDGRIQSYLLFEACREANQQALDLGMTAVPLPVLEPAPVSPTVTPPTPVTTRPTAPPTARRSTR